MQAAPFHRTPPRRATPRATPRVPRRRAPTLAGFLLDLKVNFVLTDSCRGGARLKPEPLFLRGAAVAWPRTECSSVVWTAHDCQISTSRKEGKFATIATNFCTQQTTSLGPLCNEDEDATPAVRHGAVSLFFGQRLNVSHFVRWLLERVA